MNSIVSLKKCYGTFGKKYKIIKGNIKTTTINSLRFIQVTVLMHEYKILVNLLNRIDEGHLSDVLNKEFFDIIAQLNQWLERGTSKGLMKMFRSIYHLRLKIRMAR